VLEPRRDRLPVLFSRLFFLHRRHLAVPQLRDHVVPMLAVVDEGRDRLEGLEVQFFLVLLVAVAGVAIL
jgi:hypothetical protein